MYIVLDIDVACYKTGEASFAQLEGKNISVRTQTGDCTFKNIKVKLTFNKILYVSHLKLIINPACICAI